MSEGKQIMFNVHIQRAFGEVELYWKGWVNGMNGRKVEESFGDGNLGLGGWKMIQWNLSEINALGLERHSEPNYPLGYLQSAISINLFTINILNKVIRPSLVCSPATKLMNVVWVRQGELWLVITHVGRAGDTQLFHHRSQLLVSASLKTASI